MTGQLRILLALIAAACISSATIRAQKTIEQAGNVSKSATIVAIDHTKRTVTLKDAQGNVEDFVAGPEIKRFNEMKAGDSVTFSYHAAVVYQVLKPGEKPSSTPAGV